MLLEKKPFGKIGNQDVDQYILTNDLGLSVKIITYGATITSISVPGTDGKRDDLVCGFDSIDGYQSAEYLANAPYFGCTVGRYASRIKDGKFTIDGQDFRLAVNDGSNHLHGGLKGFDKQIWSASPLEGVDICGVIMNLSSEHLQEGYPGNLNIMVSFTINNKNQLQIDYRANTDQLTPISLTNHTYFNLSGFAEGILNHQATILSDAFLEPDNTNVPLGKTSAVEGTVEDLRSGKLLGECFKELETGFEHYYLFDQDLNTLKKAAEFSHLESNRKLEVYTTEPGMLFYTGYYTSDKLRRENGNQYGRFRAFCCETHRYPNGPNIEQSPGSLTQSGEEYRSTTRFQFQW